MSSTYRILCLSHDPAITVTEVGYSSPEGAEAAISLLGEHHHCDLMIGRYSYPLVELGCPASRDQPANLRCCHGGTVWTDKDWLLLLAAAYQSTDPGVQKAVVDGHHHCLPWERLRRLRAELGINVTEEQQPAPPAGEAVGDWKAAWLASLRPTNAHAPCTATYTYVGLQPVPCAEPAGHYDPDDPSTCHRNGSHTWFDYAAGAAPPEDHR